MSCFRKRKVSEIPEPSRKHLSLIPTLSTEDIRDIYIFDKIIGKGTYGIVREGYLKSAPLKKLAIKILEKDNVNNKMIILEREVMILQKLDHPNIIRFFETYQDNKYLYIVMEYCEGGELLDRIVQKKHFNEEEACEIIYKLLSALNYIHKRKFVHRDMKPENVLFLDSSENSEIKIIDFGLSNIFKSEDQKELMESMTLNTRVGTPHYVAPEVLQGNYTCACDIWSLGVVMYLLLSGNTPFMSETEAGLFKKIEKGMIVFEGKEWAGISVQAKQLILSMIKVNPKKRITSEQALRHSWFLKKKNVRENEGNRISDDCSPSYLNKNILNLLMNCKFTNKLKREILKVVINGLSSQEIMNLNQAFQEIDKNHDGVINSTDLMEVMRINGYVQSESEIQSIIHNITGRSDDTSSFLNYTDFIIATIDFKNYLDKQKIWDLFKYFDVGNKDFITLQNLIDVMARGGRKIFVNELHQIIIEKNLAKDDKINFEDFCKMLDIDQVEEFKE